MTSQRLEGRVAVVTGAGSGIGKAIAQRFAAEGAAVVIAEIDPSAGQAVEEELRNGDGSALAVPTDVTDKASVDAMLATTTDEFGRIDILVNNAVSGPGDELFGPLPDEEWCTFTGRLPAVMTVASDVSAALVRALECDAKGYERFIITGAHEHRYMVHSKTRDRLGWEPAMRRETIQQD